MKIEYSKRATADLRKVAADSRAFGETVAAAVEARIREVVARIAQHPEAAPADCQGPAKVSFRISGSAHPVSRD